MLTANFDASHGQGIEIFQDYACQRLLKGVTPITIATSPTAVRTSFSGTLWLLAPSADVTLSNGVVCKAGVTTQFQATNLTLTGTVASSTTPLHVIGIDTNTSIT